MADDRHVLALERFQFVAEAERKQRTRELEALRFAAGEQWTDAARQARQGQPTGSQPAIGARPCLTINLLAQPLKQLMNQFHEADLGIHIAPKDDEATEGLATLLEDFYTEIQHAGQANVARAWAFKHAITMGRGYYLVASEYEGDEGDGEDQRICFKRILNQFSVYIDPFAVEPDACDAGWEFLTDNVPWDVFKKEHPKSQISTMSDSELESYADKSPEWATTSDTGKSVRVAQYWERIKGKDGEYTATCTKMSGTEFLSKEEPSNSCYLPIVRVIGEEWYLGNERRWDGLPADSMDAQRSYNAMRSAQVEAVALAPKPPFLVAAGQIEQFKTWWDQANLVNFPYLPYSSKDVHGQFPGPPQRVQSSADIQAVTIAAQQAQQDVRATSGVPELGLGNLDGSQSQISRKAIVSILDQTDLSTKGYLSNLATISLPYEAKVVLDLIPAIYDRPGRQVHVRAKDGKRRKVTLNQPYQEQPGGPTKNYDLTQGAYGVSVTVGKSFARKSDEESEIMGQAIQADPSLMTVFGDLYLGKFDEALKARMQAVLDPRVISSIQGGEDLPPQAKAQMTAMGAQLQQAQAAIQQMQGIIQGKQVESQAKLQEAQMDNQSRERIAWIQASAQIGIAQEKVDAENARTYLDAWEKRASKTLDLHMERLNKILDMTHEAAMTGQTQPLDHAHAAGLAAMAHQHAIGQAQHAADIAPPPVTPNGQPPEGGV